MLAQRALFEILRASSRSRVEDRLLARAQLDALARATFVDLTEWAEKHHPERLPLLLRNLEQEVRDQRALIEKTQQQVQALADEPVDRVRRTSERSLTRLRAFASLKTRSGTFSFVRPVASAMAEMQGPFLVIGAPGAGKSGALCSLTDELRARGEDVVVASVDTLPDPDALLEGLRRWPNDGRQRTLVVDALDAARGEAQAARVRELLENLFADSGDWRIVASIRTFDLQARSELAALFTGSPHSNFRDPRFPGVAHVLVEPLTDTELDQLASGYTELHAVIHRAPAPLKQLLRVPFHLSLVALLLLAGDDVPGLEHVRTQIELLNRYWERRVCMPPEEKLPRSAILKRMCDEIVRSRVFWTDVECLSGLEHLHGLLSEQVLVHPPGIIGEFDEMRVGFSHHLFFDYACARLWMPRAADRLADALRVNPDLILVARPSLDMYLRLLWDAGSGRESFWDTVLAVASETNVHEAAQLVGPAIAADYATNIHDFKPLFNAFQPNGRPAAARRVLTHIVGSLRLAASDAGDTSMLTAEPWPRVIEFVVTNFDKNVWWRLLPLLRDACMTSPSEDAATFLGTASRRILAEARAEPHEQLIALATRAVVQTFASDPLLSRGALMPLLEPEALDAWGHETLFELSKGALDIAATDPDFVENLYIQAFRAAFEPQDEEHSIDRGGPVLGLRFRRGDMMRGGVHELSEIFPTLLARDPSRGIRILQNVLGAFPRSYAFDSVATTFLFGSRKAEIVEDTSVVWDNRLHAQGEEHVKMLDAFEARLVDVCRTGVPVSDRESFLDALASEGREAAFWRRTLHAATIHPDSVGVTIAPLLAVREVLLFTSTTTQAGTALAAVYQYLAPEAQLTIERAILSLDAATGGLRASQHTVTARLLGCLPRDSLITKEARAAFDGVQAGEGFPPNVPGFQMHVSAHLFDELQHLREQGVDLDTQSAAAIVNAIAPLRTFLEATGRRQPIPDDLTQVLSEAIVARDLLAHDAAQRLPLALIDHAWTKIALVLERVAEHAADIGADVDATLAPLTLALVSAADAPGGLNVSVRRLVAGVLWILAAGSGSTRVSDTLESWSKDPDPEVRFRVACNVHRLRGRDDARLARLLDEFEANEKDPLVWGGIAAALHHLLEPMSDRARKLVLQGLAVVSDAKFRQLLVHHLVELAVVHDDAAAATQVDAIIERPASSDAAAVALKLVQLARCEPVNEVGRAISERAWLFTTNLATTSGATLSVSKKNLPAQMDAARAAAQTLTTLVRPLGHYIKELATISHARGKYDTVLGAAFARVDPIFDVAAGTGEAALVHIIVETLPARRLVDRRGTFLRAAELVRSGFAGGYQTDSIAADAIVAFLERYLADDRALLQDDRECREALFAILDVFIRAGWENARRLTYGLDDIFR